MKLCEDGGSLEDRFPSQGMPRVASLHRKQGERKIQTASNPTEVTSRANPLILNF